LSLAIYYGWIRFLAWSTGTEYTEVWDIVKQNPIAVAILRGATYLGAVYLIATGFGSIHFVID